MEKTLKGKMFSTETAKFLGRADMFGISDDSLYMKKTGDFFLHKKFHASGIYSEHEEIAPMSYKEAQKWTYQFLGVEAYYEVFVKPLENTSNKSSTLLSLSDSSIAWLRKKAGETGIPMSEIVDSLIKKEKDSSETDKKVPKYQPYYEGVEFGDWMCVDIVDILGDEIRLEAMAYEKDFPYLEEAIKAGMEQKSILEDLSDEELEEVEEAYTNFFRDGVFGTLPDEDVYHRINDIFGELVEIFGYWSYKVLKADIIEQAKKYGIFPEEIIFGDDTITPKDLEKHKGKFYYEVLKKLYIDQENAKRKA
ncbi:MAG: hypothetical protein NC177_14170 [Ruminococcus flavefaciens]|nr:hypothetical protein [Ruminococcus flavefaciens]